MTTNYLWRVDARDATFYVTASTYEVACIKAADVIGLAVDDIKVARMCETPWVRDMP